MSRRKDIIVCLVTAALFAFGMWYSRKEPHYEITMFKMNHTTGVLEPEELFTIPASALEYADIENFRIKFTANGRSQGGAGVIYRIIRVR